VVAETGDCPFCRWRDSDSPIKVYEDADTFVAVDQRQPREGHLLVMPKRHVENLFELDDALGGAVMRTTRLMAVAAQKAFACDGISLWQSNGKGAHQEVPHFHMHVMPRWVGDGLLRIYPDGFALPDPEVRAGMARRIRAQL
jgi:histidine triad (HIT) family protein